MTRTPCECDELRAALLKQTHDMMGLRRALVRAQGERVDRTLSTVALTLACAAAALWAFWPVVCDVMGGGR